MTKQGTAKLPEKTLQLLNALIQQAADDKVVIAGFAFMAEPTVIVNFGTCKDCGDLKLFEELCRFREDKKRQGLIEVTIVQRPV